MKPKGGLRLDTPSWVFKGGENGAAYIAGKPEKSPLYTLTALDPDDDDIMPAKGDPLSSAQQKILSHWIEEGASFGDWNDAAVASATELPPAILDLLNRLNKQGAIAMPVAQGSSWLSVDFRQCDPPVDDVLLKSLIPLKDHLVELNLARSAVTASGLVPLKAFTVLENIDLSGMKVNDSALKPLMNLPALHVLNLYDVSVGDDVIPALIAAKVLRKVILSETGVSKTGVAAPAESPT